MRKPEFPPPRLPLFFRTLAVFGSSILMLVAIMPSLDPIEREKLGFDGIVIFSVGLLQLLFLLRRELFSIRLPTSCQIIASIKRLLLLPINLFTPPFRPRLFHLPTRLLLTAMAIPFAPFAWRIGHAEDHILTLYFRIIAIASLLLPFILFRRELFLIVRAFRLVPVLITRNIRRKMKSHPISPKLILLLATLALLLLLAWFFRYEYINDAGHGTYRINRWTGKTEIIYANKILPVE